MGKFFIRSLFGLVAFFLLVLLATAESHAELDKKFELFDTFKIIEAGDDREREHAILSLLNRRDEKIFETKVFNRLLQLLKDPNPDIRYAAIKLMFPLSFELVPWDMSPPQKHLNSLMSIMNPALFPRITEVAFDALSEENNPWVREALIDLIIGVDIFHTEEGGQKNPRVVALLISALSAPNPYIRMSAVGWLARLAKQQDPRVESIFRNMIINDVWMVRDAISRLGGLSRFEDLLVEIQDESAAIRGNAVLALRQRYPNDPRTLGVFLERLNDRNLWVVTNTIEALGFLKKPEAVPPLLDLFASSKNKFIKDTIRRAVKEISNETLEMVLKKQGPSTKKVPFLVAPIRRVDVAQQLKLLNEKDHYKRVAAVLRLGETGSPNFRRIDLPSVRIALLENLKDPVPLVRYVTLEVLPSLGKTSEVFEVLVKMTHDTNQHVRMNAISALSRFINDVEEYDHEVIQVMKQIVENESSLLTRFVVAKGLLASTGTHIAEVLFQLLNDVYPDTRRLALRKINIKCFPEARHRIAGLLDDPMPAVRRYAILQLRAVSVYLDLNEANKIWIMLAKIAEQDPLDFLRKEAQKGLKEMKQRKGQEKKIASGRDCHPDELKKTR